MTKAELLHRFRWVPLALPLASAAGFCVLSVAFEQVPVTSASLPPAALPLWSLPYFFAVHGWCVLTLVAQR